MESLGLRRAAHIPLFLYPFLNTVSKTRPFEYLRLTSLGVIGALVKVDGTLPRPPSSLPPSPSFRPARAAPLGHLRHVITLCRPTPPSRLSVRADADVINFLLSTEIIPLCLRIMETGSELSKTVATFIVQKILLDETGLAYICATAERFYAVSTVLANLVGTLVEQPSARLLKHIVRCFLRLSDNPRAREALRQCLPDALRDATFSTCLKDDVTTKRWLTQLLFNITESAQHVQ